MPSQAGRTLVPLARHGDESAAAGSRSSALSRAWRGISGAAAMKVSDAAAPALAPRSAREVDVDEAYVFCRAIAHKHGANFSVGFRFLPRLKRRRATPPRKRGKGKWRWATSPGKREEAKRRRASPPRKLGEAKRRRCPSPREAGRGWPKAG